MITVRQATAGDQCGIDAVNLSATATLRQTYRPNKKALANRVTFQGQLHRLVATINDSIVGTVQYMIEGQSIRLIGLGVREEFRRRGVAREIVRALEGIAQNQGLARLLLHTVKETGNVDVFKRLGFTAIAESQDDFAEPSHHKTLTDVEMSKVIP